MNTNNAVFYETFLRLVRLGIGHTDKSGFKFQDSSFKSVDWERLKALADAQGLSAVVLDGMNSLPLKSLDAYGMPQMLRLEWIGEVLQNYEARYKAYEKAIGSLAGWYNEHGFKMMVLKGYACALDWPRPEHRPCGDIDIWLFGAQKEADEVLSHTDFTDNTDKIAGQARNEGFRVQNQSRIRELENRVVIDNSHHHHTVFEWQGFTVENHYDFVNVHAHRSSREMEAIFKVLGDFRNVDDNLNDNYGSPDGSKFQENQQENLSTSKDSKNSNQELENSRMSLQIERIKQKGVAYGSKSDKNLSQNQSRILETYGTSDQGRARELENSELLTAEGTNITNVLVNGEKVYLPSANLHGLFLMKHMVSHFAAAEISLRQVLDWAFFVEKHTNDVDWKWLEGLLEKYHIKEFYNCINAICVEELGFDSLELRVKSLESVDSVEFKSLKDRVLGDILEPEWTAAEPRGFFRRMVYKYRRWQGNAWKQRLCYDESRTEMFWRGLWAKVILLVHG